MSKPYSFLPPGQGPNYDWANDHTFVKVGASDTAGAYTLMEDNLKQNFRLGLHMHKTHAETFYILSGNIDFYVDGEWMTAEPGACLHIPPGVPHACELQKGTTDARMLMIFQPSGFEQYLEELSKLTDVDFANETTMTALNEKYDIINLGDVPSR